MRLTEAFRPVWTLLALPEWRGAIAASVILLLVPVGPASDAPSGRVLLGPPPHPGGVVGHAEQVLQAMQPA